MLFRFSFYLFSHFPHSFPRLHLGRGLDEGALDDPQKNKNKVLLECLFRCRTQAHALRKKEKEAAVRDLELVSIFEKKKEKKKEAVRDLELFSIFVTI